VSNGSSVEDLNDHIPVIIPWSSTEAYTISYMHTN
jgi:hypothetical protein